MSLSTNPYKGTRDFYPDDYRIQKWMFDTLRDVVGRFGYLEYDGPMLESFELYAAKTGEEIVSNQLYWFMDRGERKVAMRPEMTPTLARMVAAKRNELPLPVRWFSFPNLWRYERPQRGRLREHWQLNVDILGGESHLADSEILQLSIEIFKAFGGEKHGVVKVNHRGLIDFVFQEKLKFSPEVALKATKALDQRAKIGEEKYSAWIKELGISADDQKTMEAFFQSDFKTVQKEFDCKATKELESLFSRLNELGYQDQVQFDPMILRGMDYYTGTVFEMYDTHPDNNRAMFGGGRYDNLMGLFGKEALSGVGFGMGDVTLRNFLETHQLLPEFQNPIDVYVTLPEEELSIESEKIANSLRGQGFKVMTPLKPGKFANQLKQANRHQARFVVLLGKDELKDQKVALKDLKSGDQITPKINELGSEISKLLS